MHPIRIAAVPDPRSSSENFFLKRSVANPIPIGGTAIAAPTPPIKYGNVSTCVCANVAATLLIGPPISTPIIAPNNNPRGVFAAPDIPFSDTVIQFINAAIGFPKKNTMAPPEAKVPNNG